MTPEIVIPLCPNCQTELVKKTKDEKTYYACPNWKPFNKGCKGYFWSADKPRPKEKPEVIRETSTKDQILIATLDGINERLDAMEKGFADKMANLKKILILIEQKIDDKRPNKTHTEEVPRNQVQ